MVGKKNDTKERTIASFDNRKIEKETNDRQKVRKGDRKKESSKQYIEIMMEKREKSRKRKIK